MKKLTEEQKKIIYIALAVIVIISVFWIFVFAPQRRRLAAMKKRLRTTEAQIAQIQDITQGKDLTTAVTELNQTFAMLTSTLPAGEKAVIHYLSEQARKFKVEVKNIALLDKRPVEHGISGFTVEEQPISMKLVCGLRSLGEYLNILGDGTAMLIKIRRLDIQGSGEGQPDLDIRLQISVYLSG